MTRLYITRKRKKWKFYHFNQWPNCWQVDDITSNELQEFVRNRPLTIEVGAGTADLSVELARRYPEPVFIACDIKSDRLYTGAKKTIEEKLDNVRFLRIQARDLAKLIPRHSVDTIWLTFPDPYPRKGDAKHRLTQPTFLKMYTRLLKPGGVLLFKTDNKALFDWSVEQFEQHGWKIKGISRDLHTSQLPEDYKITTTFERRFMQAQQPIYFLQAVPVTK